MIKYGMISKSTVRAVFYSYFTLAVVVVVGLLVRNHLILAEANIARESSTVLRSAAEDGKFVIPKKIEYLYGEVLLEKLREGRSVIFFRHFATDHRHIKEDKTKSKHQKITIEELFESCDLQRPLSDYGRWQARQVYSGLMANNIPVGKVLSSPYCRTMEGAKIAFGVDPSALRGLIYRTPEYPRSEMSAYFMPLLAELPGSGNTVIMAHRTHMDDIATIAEGEAYIFEPLGDGEFNLIGRIKAEEWLLASIDPYALGASHLQLNSFSKSSNNSKF